VRVLRTYARAYVTNLDEALGPLTSVTGTPAALRFTMPNGLELAAVGAVLVVAGEEQTLAPYRSTQATLIVDDLDECQSLLSRAGAQVLRGPDQVPTGRNLTARLPGGIQIEYVEWDRAQWDRMGAPEPAPHPD
jgi:hypothetical protein